MNNNFRTTFSDSLIVFVIVMTKYYSFDKLGLKTHYSSKPDQAITTNDKIITNQLGLIRLAKELGNVSQVCKVMGYSRDSFYRFRELHVTEGEEALQEMRRREPNPKNRVIEATEQAVTEMAFEYPLFGQVRAFNEFKERGMSLKSGASSSRPAR